MDVSAVITAHREGVMAGASLRSLLDATARAREAGLSVEIIVMLDNADEPTSVVFADATHSGWKVERVELGDQGLARNRAVEIAKGDYVAFLDADDLWSENWLVVAHDACQTDPGRVIAHPALNWFFDQNNNLFFHADQTDPDFDPNFLRIANYWDALCMAPRAAYQQHPFTKRAVKEGFAYEDWHWNCETLIAGYVHRVAQETIHFKRRRSGSQTLEASGNRCLTRASRIFDYSWLEKHRLGTLR